MTRTPTRRDALKMLGAGAAIYSCAPAHALSPTPHPIDPKVHYFGLDRVRLGAGPFLAAQTLDADYLLKLEPDRMLANFRKNAGLEAKAPVYGGWESVEPWIWIRCHGHTLGHYLGAAACMYQSTGDERFAQRVDYLVAELAECQAKSGGWLTAFPDGVAPLLDSLAGKEFAGVPWYTTHKVMAGLRDAHRYRGSKQALEVWVTFSDWVIDAAQDVPAERFQKMLDREHGGMNEVFADLFEITRDRQYFDMAMRFSHRALLEPLSEGVDKLDGLHANTQIPKVIGFARIHEVGGGAWGDTHDRAARFFWDTVVNQRSFATGGHGDGEHFFPKLDLRRAPALREDHGDLLHAQHAAAHALTLFAGAARGILRLLRACALQRHPRLAGPRDGHEHVLPGDSARLRAALSHAVRFVLVLHRLRHRKPRALRRVDLRARRRIAVPSTCSWRRRSTGASAA